MTPEEAAQEATDADEYRRKCNIYSAKKWVVCVNSAYTDAVNRSRFLKPEEERKARQREDTARHRAKKKSTT